MVKVKICGVTNLDDALSSIRFGADALGFNFYPKSPRYMAPEAAASIIKQLPPFVVKVGVFVNEKYDLVRDVIQRTQIQSVQFHGDEEPEFCDRFGMNVIKAFRAGEKPERISRYKSLSGILIDSPREGYYGGTGKSFDWKLMKEYRSLEKPVILSGGLSADNVIEAIEAVHPYAVDACSRLEKSPGVKEHGLLKLFITRVKEAKTV